MWVVTIKHSEDIRIAPTLTYFDNSRRLRMALILFIEKDKILGRALLDEYGPSVTTVVDKLIEKQFFTDGKWWIRVEEIITRTEDILELPYEYTHNK